MRITFYIRYFTRPGESLHLCGDIDLLGNNDPENALPLCYLDNEYWYGTLEVDPARVARIQYEYIFRNQQGELVREGFPGRRIDISGTGLEAIQVIDSWNYAGEYENLFYTDPFRKVLLPRPETRRRPKSPKNFTHIFRVKAPLLKKHEAVFLLGNDPAMREWDLSAPLLLQPEGDWWSIRLQLLPQQFPLEYKYGIYNTKEKTATGFEAGENRVLRIGTTEKTLHILHDGFLRAPNTTWKGAGVSVPVFSLRSSRSFGVGEFTDLKYLADWARKTGLQLIQLLPVNDTISTNTWRDSYPYSAISAFALHPLYLNLEALAGKAHADLLRPLRKKQRQLNELPEVDYEQVLRFKLSTAREIFDLQQQKFLKDDHFREFFEENRHWLIPYAAFCYLRDRNGTADFRQWKLYSQYEREAIEKYVSPKSKHYKHICFTYFLQYHLHRQLQEAADHAHSNGIILKGDIPIGVSPYSCEAWMDPQLFHTDLQSGAPPDDFALKGQNWGFPTYNWDKMAEDHFDWWRSRFKQMAGYFDAFRIDHILGFFRMWSIPIESVQGIMGYFSPALPVHVYEFGQRGMWFNYHRFCKPYITDAVLWELFGPNKDKFLPFLCKAGNHYELLDAFSTQRKTEMYFKELPDNAENRRLREGLYELISNVILFEVKDSQGQQFHFRIAMDQTSSFRHLDDHIQQQLKQVYTDYFYHRQNDLWQKEALKRLTPLKRTTNMMICGEDLGMIPSTVPEVMQRLGILSLEIQRMPKQLHQEFSNPATAPYLSVVSPSTHDMPPVREWWEEDPQKTQRFFNQELGQWGQAPAQCPAWINKAIVIQHLYSPAIWSVFQIQDLTGMEETLWRKDGLSERVNIPADPQHFWRYRMHISLEQLLREKSFNEELKKYISSAGR